MGKFAARGITLTAGGNLVGQITQLGEAGSSRGLIDASAYGDDWKDYVLDQQDGSEMPLVVAYDPEDADHEFLKDEYDDAGRVFFGMQHVESGFDVEFPAIITQLTRGGALGGLLQMSMTLKIVEPGVTDAT